MARKGNDVWTDRVNEQQDKKSRASTEMATHFLLPFYNRIECVQITKKKLSVYRLKMEQKHCYERQSNLPEENCKMINSNSIFSRFHQNEWRCCFVRLVLGRSARSIACDLYTFHEC